MCCRSQCTDVVGPAVPLSLPSRCCIPHVIMCFAPFQTVALALSSVALSVCLSMALFCIYRGLCPAIEGHPIQSIHFFSAFSCSFAPSALPALSHCPLCPPASFPQLRSRLAYPFIPFYILAPLPPYLDTIRRYRGTWKL